MGKQLDVSTEYVGDIVLETIVNPNELTLQSFYQSSTDVNLFANSLSNQTLIVNGFEAVRFMGIAGMIPSDTVSVDKGNIIIEITDVGQLHQTDGLFDMFIGTIR